MTSLTFSANTLGDKCCTTFLRMCYAEEIYSSILDRCQASRIVKQQLQRNLLMFINIIILHVKFNRPLKFVVNTSKHIQLFQVQNGHELYSWDECLVEWKTFENTEFSIQMKKIEVNMVELELNTFLMKYRKTKSLLVVQLPYGFPIEYVNRIPLAQINQSFWRVVIKYRSLFQFEYDNSLTDKHKELMEMLTGKPINQKSSDDDPSD